MRSQILFTILFSLSVFTAAAQMKVPASYGNSIAFGAEGTAAIGPVVL